MAEKRHGDGEGGAAKKGANPASTATGAKKIAKRLDGRILKGLGLAAMLFGFSLGLGAIDDIAWERQAMRETAGDAVTHLWGPPQELAGPVAIFSESVFRESKDGMEERAVLRTVLPRRLKMSVRLESEIKRRGLFDIPVYTATVSLEGAFDAAEMAPPPGSGLSRTAPVLAFSLTDAAALKETPAFEWRGEPVSVPAALPAAARSLLGADAVAATLSPGAGETQAEAGEAPFAIALTLKGSDRLRIAPSGQYAEIDMASDWPHPSFVGSRTASEHLINDTGFEARWRLTPFGRNLEPVRTVEIASLGAERAAGIASGAFGVALVQPVDPYRMTERALKYGLLFVLYTFGAFLLLETVYERRLHPVHYLLAGASVASFFLLLLSLSEIAGFAGAYGIGALAVVGQCGLYARSILAERRLALGFAGVLAGLYAGLFGLLHLMDTALVAGSLALFAGIGLAMFLTRRIGGNSATPAINPQSF